MNAKIVLSILFFLFSTQLTSCGSKSESDSGNTKTGFNPDRLDWDSIPSEYNPTIRDVGFTYHGIKQIDLNVFGFAKDVEVVYSNKLSSNSGNLRIFRVWKKSASWGDLTPNQKGDELKLINYGSNSCSIQTKNGAITELEGGCVIRLQVFLPPGAEIEVYNVGQLISKRFFPIDTFTFLENLDDAFGSTDKKFDVIEEYLLSYKETNKTPSLTSSQLGVVIKEFSYSDDKFKALRMLHMYVSDKQNLDEMIEDIFNLFDQDEAKQIVGI